MSAGNRSAYAFIEDRLPPREQWPEFRYDLPHLNIPDRLNCAAWLLEINRRPEQAQRRVFVSEGQQVTYAEFDQRVAATALALAALGVGEGDRVILIGRNTSPLVSTWYAAVSLGAVAVMMAPASSPGDVELAMRRTQPSLVVTDRHSEHLIGSVVGSQVPVASLGDGAVSADVVDLEAELGRFVGQAFVPTDTSADAACLIAFTSGSTGEPKAAVHSHREVAAMCNCFSQGVLGAGPLDVFVGSSPLAFTFGLISQACYPLAVGGSAVLIDQPSPANLLDAVHRWSATFCFTVPTVYRRWVRENGPDLAGKVASVKVGIASGEPLPAELLADFQERTGLRLTNVLGSTEMLHAFMSTGPYPGAPPGSVGGPVSGFTASVVDAEGIPVARGELGLLAVKGPTGCRYLDDERQKKQVVNGWNLTGDLARQDEAGHYHVEGRADSIIVTAGYKIAAMEVERCLLTHPLVEECVVTAIPEPIRGQIVAAVVVLSPGTPTDRSTAQLLADYVGVRLARYKAPRAFDFRAALPRTNTGKISRVVDRGTGEWRGMISLLISE